LGEERCSAQEASEPGVDCLACWLFPELMSVGARGHELPKPISVEVTRVVKLVYKLCYPMVRLERGELPDFGKGAVEAAFL
jgi:hypothetical protein